MNWLHAALWGVAGGFVLEGLEFHAVLRRHGKWPWKVTGRGVRAGATGYVCAELIRLAVGGILAGAAAASGQVSGALAALAIGVAAPVMVERLAALVPIPANTSGDLPPPESNAQPPTPAPMQAPDPPPSVRPKSAAAERGKE